MDLHPYNTECHDTTRNDINGNKLFLVFPWRGLGNALHFLYFGPFCFVLPLPLSDWSVFLIKFCKDSSLIYYILTLGGLYYSKSEPTIKVWV